MLNQDQIDAYHSRGYISEEGVISPAEIAELRQVTDEFVERSRQITENDDVFDLEPGHTAGEPRLRRLKAPEKQHPAYDRIFHDDRILDRVAQLIGPDIRHFSAKLNIKSAAFGSPVGWHQDHAFCARTNDDILAVGVAIDDMSLENGCMLVIPGSHRGAIYTHYQDDYFVGAVTDPDFTAENVVPLQLAAGGITIHHGRTLHASAPNKSATLSRRLYLLQYCAADAWPVKTPPSDMDAFDADIIRGNPVAEPRYTDVPAVPEPEHIQPAPRSGSIYESQALLRGPIAVDDQSEKELT